MRIKLNIQRFASGVVGLGTSGKLEGRIVWNSTVQGSTVAEKAALNRSSVYAELQIRRIDSYTTTGTFSFDWQVEATYSGASSWYGSIGNNNWVTIASHTEIVSHNNNGTGACYFFGRVHGPSGTSMAGNEVSYGKTETLDTIPRYATSNQSLNSKTETTIKMNWSSDNTCDYLWYTINGNAQSPTWVAVGSINASSGSYTISGLTAGQTYNIKTRVRRKDSQLPTDSSNLSIKTYDYPKLDTNGGPDFYIESPVTLTIYNPLSKQCTITVYDKNGNEIGSTTTSNTIAGPFLDDNTSKLRMYSSIPNDPSGRYSVKVDITGHTGTPISGGLYKANPVLCNPTFTDFTIADVNEDTRALTGDNSVQIVNYSDMAAIIHTEDKAVAKNGATMSYYRFIIGNNAPVDVTYSENLDVSAVVNKAPAGTFYVYAYDSRGLSTLKEKTPDNVINYVDIARGQISISRQNSVGEQVTLTFNGTFWNNTFGDEDNSITNVRYRYKKTDESWGDTWNGTTTIVPTTTAGSDDFSYTGNIKGDTNAGFDISFSYNIEIEVSDQLSKTVFSITLGSGVPNMAIAKGGVSINGKYDTTKNDGLQVTGKIYLNGTEIGSGGVDIPQQDNPPSNPQTNDLWIDTDDPGFELTVDGTTSTTSHNPIENQAITNYINNAIKWKLVQEVSGQTVINLPSSWNEIMIVSWMNNDIWKGMTITIPYGSPSGINYRLSYYGNDSDNANVGYYYNNNQVNLGWYNLNGGSSATLSQCKTKIYYR